MMLGVPTLWGMYACIYVANHLNEAELLPLAQTQKHMESLAGSRLLQYP